MKSCRLLCAWGLALLVLVAAGCSTPARRIRQNAELFASYPAEVQEKIGRGEVDVGYTRAMVYMALGRPSRVYDRQTRATNTEIWAYSDLLYLSDYRPIETTYWYRDSLGRRRLGRDWDWVDVGRPIEREFLRIEFSGDSVSAIERPHR
jgi:hypothetical protein